MTLWKKFNLLNSNGDMTSQHKKLYMKSYLVSTIHALSEYEINQNVNDVALIWRPATTNFAI